MGASAVAWFVTIFLNERITAKILILPFSLTFFIFALNRFVDKREDSINIPKRRLFYVIHGKKIIISSLLCLILAVYLMSNESLTAKIWFCFLLLMGIIYSAARLKRVLFLKNFAAATIWGAGVFWVGALYQRFNYQLILLFLFFAIEFFINTIILDIKDVKGDYWNNITTFPLRFGIKKSKRICLILNAVSMVFVLVLNLFNIFPHISLFLLLLNLYVFSYIIFSTDKSSMFFYGLLVNGEFIFTALILLIWKAIIA